MKAILGIVAGLLLVGCGADPAATPDRGSPRPTPSAPPPTQAANDYSKLVIGHWVYDRESLNITWDKDTLRSMNTEHQSKAQFRHELERRFCSGIWSFAQDGNCTIAGAEGSNGGNWEIHGDEIWISFLETGVPYRVTYKFIDGGTKIRESLTFPYHFTVNLVRRRQPNR